MQEKFVNKFKKIMLLDTSSSYLFINFIIDGKVEYQVMSEGKNNHSDNLLKDIEEGLDKLNLKVNDFDCIACGKGPGMYTGLRVSMTVAKTFAWTLNKDLYVISSLDLLTSGKFLENGKYAIMMKAKKDYSYTKIIEVNNGSIKTLKDEEFLANIDFMNEVSKDMKVITNDNINIDVLNIDECLFEKVDNVHALEPNYLRSDI